VLPHQALDVGLEHFGHFNNKFLDAQCSVLAASFSRLRRCFLASAVSSSSAISRADKSSYSFGRY
jgi:hypothetical protein